MNNDNKTGGPIKQYFRFLRFITSDWEQFIRSLILLWMITFAGVFLVTKIIYRVHPMNLGIKMIESTSTSTTIYFKTSNLNLEILQLPSYQFWIESNTQLGDRKEIKISASGLVSTRYDNYEDLVHFDTINYTDFIMEFERYYRTNWYDPCGNPVMHFKTRKEINTCDSLINTISENLKFLPGKKYEYGAVIGFVIDNTYENSFLKRLNEPQKMKLIDSLIAYNSDYIQRFYIGKSAVIKEKKNKYIVKTDKNKTLIDKSDFKGSRLYFTINDAVIKDTNDIVIGSTDKLCYNKFVQRNLHSEFYNKYSRKHSLWYLDNKGSFNIIIAAE